MDSPYSYHDEYWIKQHYDESRFISFVQGQIIYLQERYRNEKLEQEIWKFFIMLTSGEVKFASLRIVRANEPKIEDGTTFYQPAIGSNLVEKRYLSYEESMERIKKELSPQLMQSQSEGVMKMSF